MQEMVQWTQGGTLAGVAKCKVSVAVRRLTGTTQAGNPVPGRLSGQRRAT